MPPPRFMCRASHPIFVKQWFLRGKASTAGARYRNSRLSSAKRITIDEHKLFIRYRHPKTRGAWPVERRSFCEPRLRTRAGDSKDSRAASTLARVKFTIATPEHH